MSVDGASRELGLVVALEARLLWRHGVVGAIAVVAATWAGALRALRGRVDAELAADLVAVALYLDAAIVGMLFIAAAILIERRQGSLDALAVSPVRPASYLAAKVLTLTGLALVATIVIAVAGAPHVHIVPLALAVMLLSPPVLLVAVAVVARTETITTYLVRVQVPLSPAVLPLVAVAGWLPWPVAWLAPTTGPFRLLQAGTGGTPLSPIEWLLAIVVPLLTIAWLWRYALRSVTSGVLRAGRAT